MITIIAAAATLIVPVNWSPPHPPSDKPPPCWIPIVDPHNGYSACIYWGHAENREKAVSGRYNSNNAEPTALSRQVAAGSGELSGLLWSLEAGRRNAIAQAAKVTPSGACIVGVVDPHDSTVICAQSKP